MNDADLVKSQERVIIMTSGRRSATSIELTIEDAVESRTWTVIRQRI